MTTGDTPNLEYPFEGPDAARFAIVEQPERGIQPILTHLEAT